MVLLVNASVVVLATSVSVTFAGSVKTPPFEMVAITGDVRVLFVRVSVVFLATSTSVVDVEGITIVPVATVEDVNVTVPEVDPAIVNPVDPIAGNVKVPLRTDGFVIAVPFGRVNDPETCPVIVGVFKVNPVIVESVPPRETPDVPIVIDEFCKDVFGIFVVTGGVIQTSCEPFHERIYPDVTPLVSNPNPGILNLVIFELPIVTSFDAAALEEFALFPRIILFEPLLKVVAALYPTTVLFPPLILFL
jgi:hypothetical protein